MAAVLRHRSCDLEIAARPRVLRCRRVDAMRRGPVRVRSPLLAVVVAVDALVVVAAGCDDAARAARRADAIDVAGAWVDDADVDAVVDVTIENEADKNDVRVVVVRAAVSAAEAALVAGVDVDDNNGDDFGVVVVMGDGPDEVRAEGDGGENVSFDGGATTRVNVDGDDVDAAPLAAGATDARLRYSLVLTGDSDGLAGTLVLSHRERRPRPGETDGASTEAEAVRVPLALRRVSSTSPR
jgi:hypothetical protein